MRHRLATIIPFLLFAACGRSSDLDRSDGSFDRDRYRPLALGECKEGLRQASAPGSDADQNSLCACIVDRVFVRSSDDQLRDYHRQGGLPPAEVGPARQQCSNAGRFDVPEDEPPPPEEPPPSMSGDTPGPVVGAPPGTVMPDAGGAPASGGGRARARANLASYFTADDYPAAALRNNQQGRVTFTVDVGPDGRVTGCQVRESSGTAALDMATCRIVRARARFTPARNARGIAVADRSQGAVTWRLP